MLGDAAADVDQKGAGAAGGVVDLDFLPIAQMIRHDFRHEQTDFVRGVELTRLLAGVCGELADQVFINEAKHIIVLLAVHGNVLDQVDQVADCFRAAGSAVAQLGQSGFQRLEDFVKDLFVIGIDEPAESGKRIGDVGDVENLSHGQPRGEQILICDEVAHVVADVLHGVVVLFRERLDILLLKALLFQIAYFLVGEKFVKDKTKNIILVLIRFDFGTHFVCGFPYFICKLLFVHEVFSSLSSVCVTLSDIARPESCRLCFSTLSSRS